MTYPPQPGQPGPQPGAWGQPQQSAMPPSGPLPQQQPPGAYPGAAGPNQFGQYPGGPGQQPPKKKTGLIVGVTIAAVAVIGGVVTALILLLGNDDEDKKDSNVASPPQQSAPQAPGAPSNGLPADSSAPNMPGQPSQDVPAPGGTGDTGGIGATGDEAAVEALADTLVEALNNRDAETADSLLCPDEGGVFGMDVVPDGATFSRGGAVTVTGDTATIPVQATFDGETEEGSFPARKEGGTWCLGV